MLRSIVRSEESETGEWSSIKWGLCGSVARVESRERRRKLGWEEEIVEKIRGMKRFGHGRVVFGVWKKNPMSRFFLILSARVGEENRSGSRDSIRNHATASTSALNISSNIV
ncbi:hypothetical protein M5K25_003898 [Dendrobium thyrsiflorum]|uniref:Uncharacterized protein n=1 Tax=Dendrobium thyrsiflorum TaxID=117978 RepID=A0ABD0VSN0_DENTH